MCIGFFIAICAIFLHYVNVGVFLKSTSHASDHVGMLMDVYLTLIFILCFCIEFFSCETGKNKSVTLVL